MSDGAATSPAALPEGPTGPEERAPSPASALRALPSTPRKPGRPKGSRTHKRKGGAVTPEKPASVKSDAPAAVAPASPARVKWRAPVTPGELAAALAKASGFAHGYALQKAPRLAPVTQALGWTDWEKSGPADKASPPGPSNPIAWIPTMRASEGADLVFPLMRERGWLEFELSTETAFVLGCAVLVAPAIPPLLTLGLEFAFPKRRSSSSPAETGAAPLPADKVAAAPAPSPEP